MKVREVEYWLSDLSQEDEVVIDQDGTALVLRANPDCALEVGSELPEDESAAG